MAGCEIPAMAETCKVKGKLHVIAEILRYKCHPNQFFLKILFHRCQGETFINFIKSTTYSN